MGFTEEDHSGKYPSCDITACTHTGNLILRLGVSPVLAMLVLGFFMVKLFSFFYTM